MQANQETTLTRIPVYTPHLANHRTLEALTVVNETVLPQLIANAWRNISDNTPHFTLLSGPSGCGKTHLLSVFYGRLMADESLCQHYQVVWFAERAWDIGDYADLLLQLLEYIKPEQNDNDFNQQLDAVYLLSETKLIKAAEHLLLGSIEQKSLLFLCENFNRILEKLGNVGQRRFKTLLQNNNKLSIIATTKKPLQAVNKNHPLMALFKVEPLQTLSLEASRLLLTKVAQLNGNAQLAERFNALGGKVSVDVLHHLAAGNARIYVAFAQWVKQAPLSEFTCVMRQILDEQTPYYQSKLKQLPAQQQKLLHFLARQRGTTTVYDIAKYNRITQQTASGQLKKLRDGGFVTSTAVGRTSHYELAAPLMRLALLVKHPLSTHIPNLLDFLRHWFATGEQGLLFEDGQCFVFTKAWLHQSCLAQPLPLNIRLQHIIKGYLSELSQGNSSQFEMLRGKLQEVGNHIQSNANDTMALEHTDLLYGLACHNLTNDNQQNAQLLCQDMYAFADNIDSSGVWKHLCQLTVKLTALFGVANKIDDTFEMLSQLEKIEAKLHSLPFSIGLSHCLIGKAKGYALFDDKAKAQQALEQLRVRAEKRNSPEIAGAFCHGVLHTMGYFASNDEKQALKLFRQVEDITNKYHHNGLLFSCARALWAALPKTLPFVRIVELINNVHTLNTFNRETYLILLALTDHSADDQQANQALLWNKMLSLGCQAIFSAGLIQVSLSLAKQAPSRYDAWLMNCTTLLNSETALQHCKQILLAIQRYLQNDCDIHQLLVLPIEERGLILSELQ